MKLFEKNPVTFAVILIVLYVVGFSVMQRISDAVGVPFLAETLLCIVLTAVLLVFIKKNGLSAYLGLQKPNCPAAGMLFYLPLFLVSGVGMCFGLGMEYGIVPTILHTVMMCGVGFLEEVIFRGFLFRGIARQNLTRGIVIASLTFALGHFVNLLNGSDIAENAAQVIYAAAVGFLLTFVFLRTGSILPCIAFHAFNNCLTVFTTGKLLTDRLGEQTGTLLMLGIQLAIAAGYLVYVVRRPRQELPERAA